jgi:predicted metal-dependent phosphoesterase TrpH
VIVDLHSHSYYSDGIYSPSKVAEKAKQNGCELLALTDHDTTAGTNEAQRKADELGLKLIHGCEISALWQGITIHIVALDIDINNKDLQQVLTQHQNIRAKRAENIANYLAQKGVNKPMLKVQNIVKKDMITRTHFARMLVNEKICTNMNEVFSKYLANENRSVKANWESFDNVIRAIQAAGGKAVLAHPLRYKISKARLRVLFREFKERDGDGVEIITSRTHDNQINHLIGLAYNNNLLFSAGSDFHGDNKFCQLGKIKQFKHNNNIWHYL